MGETPSGRYDWNSDTIRWYREASDFTGYSVNLAAILLSYLRPGESLCDMGCGLGLTSLELAGFAAGITCVDISEQAIAYLRQEAEMRHIENLNAVCADGITLPGEWDTILCIFRGHPEEVILPYLKKARKRLLYITRTSAGNGHHMDAAAARDLLDRNHIPFTECQYELEFGQPHRNMEDAIAFVRAYYPRIPESGLREYVRRHSRIETREGYALYMPKTRAFTLFSISRE